MVQSQKFRWSFLIFSTYLLPFSLGRPPIDFSKNVCPVAPTENNHVTKDNVYNPDSGKITLCCLCPSGKKLDKICKSDTLYNTTVCTDCPFDKDDPDNQYYITEQPHQKRECDKAISHCSTGMVRIQGNRTHAANCKCKNGTHLDKSGQSCVQNRKEENSNQTAIISVTTAIPPSSTLPMSNNTPDSFHVSTIAPEKAPSISLGVIFGVVGVVVVVVVVVGRAIWRRCRSPSNSDRQSNGTNGNLSNGSALQHESNEGLLLQTTTQADGAGASVIGQTSFTGGGEPDIARPRTAGQQSAANSSNGHIPGDPHSPSDGHNQPSHVGLPALAPSASNSSTTDSIGALLSPPSTIVGDNLNSSSGVESRQNEPAEANRNQDDERLLAGNSSDAASDDEDESSTNNDVDSAASRPLLNQSGPSAPVFDDYDDKMRKIREALARKIDRDDTNRLVRRFINEPEPFIDDLNQFESTHERFNRAFAELMKRGRKNFNPDKLREHFKDLRHESYVEDMNRAIR